MLNKILLIGRLTNKPELKYTNSNLPYTRFTIAVNRNYSNNDGQRETDFINVITWRKQAENVCNYLDKGSLIMVEGSLSINSYEDQDGNKRISSEVIAQNVKFLDSKKSSNNDEIIDNEIVDISDDFLE